IFGGMPYVEAFHGDIFYPGSVLKFILDWWRWQGWTLIIHFFLAGLFMYGAARQFRLSKMAAVLSGVCYMFASLLISWVSPGHDGKIYVASLFPAAFWCLQHGFTAETKLRSFMWFSGLGAVIGCVILSPHPQMSYFTLWALALYTLFKLIVILRESRSVKHVIRPAVLTAYAVVIGLLISAIQFYPGYKYTSNFSPRADSKRGWQWATSWSMHEEELFAQVIPEFAGTSSGLEGAYYWGKNFFKDNSEAIGIVTIFMGLAGFFFYRRKESYFFGGLAVLAVVYALGATTPIFKLFFYVIPMVKSLRAPSVIMFIFSFSMALLAGMGLQHIIDEKRGEAPRKSPWLNRFLLGFPAIMFLLALLFSFAGKGMMSLWAWLFHSEASRSLVRAGVSKLDLAYMSLPAVQKGAWLAFLFSAAVALCIWLYRTGRLGQGILVAVLLVPVIDGVRFNSRFVNTFDAPRYWSPNPVTEFFERTPGHYRVMNFAANVIPEDFLPFFGVEVAVGYHGNQLRWYDRLLGGPNRTNDTNPRLLNLAGARYILNPSGRQWADGYFGEKPLAMEVNLGPVEILRNDNALPRVFLADEYRVLADTGEIYSEVLSGSDDLRRVVYLEEQPQLSIAPDSLAVDSAWVADYQIDSVLVGVSCSHNSLLVLADNYFDAWQVFVDGRPAKLLRSYGTFRAVELPAGASSVLFKYSSERYGLGRTVTGLTLAYLVIIFGSYLYFDRIRAKPKRES
ncbi:MAG: hypothetical protein JSW34_01785, partial [Candidatus Zixiibacteriota bacterium]